MAEDGRGRLANATIQFGGRELIHCPMNMGYLYQHNIGEFEESSLLIECLDEYPTIDTTSDVSAWSNDDELASP